MIPITILPIPSDDGAIEYCAISGKRQSHRRMAGEPLDSLTTELQPEEMATMVIVQHNVRTNTLRPHNIVFHLRVSRWKMDSSLTPIRNSVRLSPFELQRLNLMSRE
jgi:hypothetical protein